MRRRMVPFISGSGDNHPNSINLSISQSSTYKDRRWYKRKQGGNNLITKPLIKNTSKFSLFVRCFPLQRKMFLYNRVRRIFLSEDSFAFLFVRKQESSRYTPSAFVWQHVAINHFLAKRNKSASLLLYTHIYISVC